MITVVAAVIRRHDKILITRRLSGVHLPDMWEFPGGKVEPGESLACALERELREELGIAVQVGMELLQTEHHYSARSVCLHFFSCSIVEGEPRALGVADLSWVSPADLHQFEFPEADKELITLLSSS